MNIYSRIIRKISHVKLFIHEKIFVDLKNKINVKIKKVVRIVFALNRLNENVNRLLISNELNYYRLQAKIAFSNPDSIPILKEFREKKLIVSLTTFPERAFEVDIVIYSLLMQSVLPDKIILWLSNEEYPNGESSVPINIVQLKKYGIEICFCKDLKSYKKLIPALKKYPNDIIVTADDDLYYATTWLQILYDAYMQDPSYIHAHRAHKITFNFANNIRKYRGWDFCIDFSRTIPSFHNFATSGGGTLYPPNSLYKDILDENIFMNISPYADDIWFWAMAVLQDTKINVVKNNISNHIYMGADRDWKTLAQLNIIKEFNDKQLKDIFAYYPKLANIVLTPPYNTFNSKEYWETRYKSSGNSGAGSYNRLALFKSDVINSFVKENQIKSVIEWGCGDGNQLSFFKIEEYLGIDVSETIIKKTKKKYSSDNTKKFIIASEYNKNIKELALSLDVIYHLIEDNIFSNYINNLFNSSSKYVIIYSSNKDEYHGGHVKHRKFTDFIETYYPNWVLINYIPNIYPEDKNDPNNTSFADFYMFHKISD